MVLIVCAAREELGDFTPGSGEEVLITGVGPVEAAATVARALALARYELVINAGIAGALPGKGEIGESVVVTADRMELDRETGEAIVLPRGVRVVDRVEADALLCDRLTALGFRAVRGVTVARVTASARTAQRLALLGAEVETMEGFAVLRGAQLAGVPAVAVRGISNLAGEPESARWDFHAGARAARRILGALLTCIGKDRWTNR